MGSSRLGTWGKVYGLLLAVVLGLLGTRGTAWANNALIVDPVLEGPLQPGEDAKLRAAPEEALREQRFDLIPAADVASALSGEPQLKGCHSDLCFERLGRVLDSQLVLRYRVRLTRPEGKPSGDWHMKVEILDVEVGAMGVRLTEDCTGCTSQRAADFLLDMTRRAILQNASHPRGLLDVQSQPPGAVVIVDGTELGVTPYKRSAFTGKHKLVLRHVGYRSEQVDATVDETQTRHIDVTLKAGNDPAEKTPVYKKWWFWVAIGGAAVAASAITAGIVVGARGSERALPENTFMVTF